MATLQHLRDGLQETWGAVREGWQKLSQRAAGALTRFTPGKEAGGGRTDLARRNLGWGLLATEVFDDADQVVVRIEAPGMDEADFDLQVRDNYLVVRGEKRVERERNEGSYYVTERAYGRFERAVPLPDAVEADKAKATYRKGVLRVELPKAADRRKRRIPVKVA